MLAYLSRYTHRVAISNSRLLAMDERGVTFRWKDYRAKGKTRHKAMTLSPQAVGRCIGDTGIGLQELAVGLPYLVGGLLLALLHGRWSAALVGLLWLAHGGYDLIHPLLFINPGVPTWYPLFCASVDIVVGLYLLALATQPSRRDLRTA